MSVQKSQADFSLRIGKKCKILGNYHLKGTAFIDDDTEVYGSITANGDVWCGNNVNIHGAISTDGEVNISEQVRVGGDIHADSIKLAKSAVVEGTLHAKNGISFIDTKKKQAEKKIQRFESNTDVVDEVTELLE